MNSKKGLMLAAVCFCLSTVAAEAADMEIKATDSGKVTVHGDLINAGRDVTINKTVGLSKEEYQKLLDEAAKKFAQEMQQPGLAAEERGLLEAKLKAVQEKLADFKKSYEEELARRRSAEKALAELQGHLSPALIAKAEKSLAQGDTTAAEQVFDEVVDKDGKSVALAAHQSGQLAEGRLDYAKAMRQYKKAVALEEDNPDYLLAAGQMARTLGDYSYAQEWLERLLKMREAEGKNDLDLATVLNEVANCYYFQGRYAEAEPLYKRSLVIKENSLGKDHPSVATTLNNLAGLYRQQGRYAEAEPLYKRSLVIKENSLGKDHPDVATTLNNLAGLYYKQEKYQEAAEMFQRAIAIMKKKFPGGHPNIDLFQGNYEYMKEKMQER